VSAMRKWQHTAEDPIDGSKSMHREHRHVRAECQGGSVKPHVRIPTKVENAGCEGGEGYDTPIIRG
jgi:hypothetical protein